jgi:serine/threonine protein kinase
VNEALSPEDRERLESLFERAAELPAAEHAAFVERECGGDAALRAELSHLLAGLEGEDILGRIQPGAPSRAGARIGPYALLERIGQGGMGEVYAAQQLEPVIRRVALKVIKPGMDSAQIVARFEAERQALARMTHPNIAQVYDGGTTPDGRPYFVMELVDGEPVTEYCDRHKLSTRERLELFVEICTGVQHAHQKGIIHRDLKPSNLLVMRQDGRAVPKIIDFGVARATTGRLAESSLHTLVGQLVGTLDYMSPEQVDPTSVDIDTRSDVYSLGVVLYQLASGLLPFETLSASGSPLSEMQRAIRETNPPTPSTRLRRQRKTATALAPLHATDERSLIRQLAGDLDWICLKALEKDPARRYQSVSELADDLRRHLAHEPVLAGRPGALYRARKFARRHRAGVSAALLVAASAVAGLFGIVSGRLEAEAQAAQAQTQRDRAADSERLARAETAKVLQLSDLQVLQELEARAGELWPPHPAKIPELEAWLERANELAAKREAHLATLAEMRERALPWVAEERERERETREADLEERRTELRTLAERVERGMRGPALDGARERIEELGEELVDLESLVQQRLTWRFELAEDQ